MSSEAHFRRIQAKLKVLPSQSVDCVVYSGLITYNFTLRTGVLNRLRNTQSERHFSCFSVSQWSE